jgi:hypothetical protein
MKLLHVLILSAAIIIGLINPLKVWAVYSLATHESTVLALQGSGEPDRTESNTNWEEFAALYYRSH